MADCDILPDVFVIESNHINQNELIEKLKLLKSSYKFEFTLFVNTFFTKIK